MLLALLAVLIVVVFAEMEHTEYVPPGWVPQFIDYLALSFWTSTAFSPAETTAIRPWTYVWT